MHYGKVLVSGNKCHKDMSGVMANTGFGPLTVRKCGYDVVVPKECLTSEGFLKTSWRKRIDSMTIGDAMWLFERGGEVHAAA